MDEQSLKKGDILAIAAHPDDEVLGCGGTLALHAASGDRVHVVIVCEGESHRYGPEGVGQKKHMQLAAETLGIYQIQSLGFQDQALDEKSMVEIISPLEKIVRGIKPRIIYCQYGGDLNRDHQLLFQAALVALRPTERYIESIYAFDTLSSTEWAYPRTFNPDTWIDISTTLQKKLKAFACYKSEVCDYPHPRSLLALEYKAKATGNQVCLDAAEAFMTVRRVLRNDKTTY